MPAMRPTEAAGHLMPPMACSFSLSRLCLFVGAEALPSALGISSRARPSWTPASPPGAGGPAPHARRGASTARASGATAAMRCASSQLKSAG
eukprot:2925958-Heterocapsa_arctica.AAC.1